MNSSPNRERLSFRACEEPNFRRVCGESIGVKVHACGHLFQHRSKKLSKPKGQHAYRKGRVVL